MRHIAIINYGVDEMAIGLGDTEDEAAANAIEAFGGAEAYYGIAEHLRHNIDIHDLVDGMRLLYNQDSTSRVYQRAVGANSAQRR